MTKQIINIGSADKGNGDPLRTAFSKVNDNFTELYTALGLDAGGLNIGSFEFTDNILSTTDSSNIIIDQAVVINSELTVHGDIVPNIGSEHNLGSLEKPFKSIYLTGSTVYFDGVPLSVTDDGTLYINSRVAATPGGDLTWDSIVNKPIFANSGSYTDLTDTPTFTASEGLTATTDVNGNVNIGFSGILYVGSQTQYGFEEIVDESGPSPIYSSRLSLPLTTEFLGGDISLTAWGPGVNITVRNTDTLDEYSWRFGNDGSITFPDSLTVVNGIIGKSSSETITEETIDGTISETTTVESQIEIAAESIVIAKRITQVTDDTVVVTTDEAGSSVTVNNSGVFIKKYVEPDGPNNTSYFQVRTNNGAILEAVEENVADETYGRVIAAQGVVEIATRADGVEKNWGFNYDGTMVVPTNSTILGTNDLTIRSESDGNSGLYFNSSPIVGSAVLYATNNVVITADYDGNRKDWNFDKSGTITVPLLLPKMFTAVLDADHKVGDPITLTGTAWQYGIGFVVNPNGAVETQMDDPTYPENPGYTVGDIFRFTEADHGIPGYTFDITLGFTFDNEAGLFVTNPSVTPPPEYPATVESTGAIKLTSNDNSWIFGTNGILTLPQYHWIESVGSNAAISLNGVGSNESIIELSTRVDGEMITSTFAMHPAYGIDLTSVRDVTITAGYDEATFKRDAWVEAEQAWVDIRNQDAADIAPGTRTWAGLPSYQAYTLLMEFMQNIAPGEIPPPVGMAVIANTAKSAYELWQAEQADIKVTITAKDNTWTFGNDGDLQLPGGATLSSDTVNGFTISQLAIDEETTLSVNFRRSGEIIVPLSIQFNLLDTPTGFVGAQLDSLIIAGNPGKAIDIAPNDGANGTWSFGTDGNLQLPEGGDIVDSNGDSVLGGGDNSYTPEDPDHWNEPTVNTVAAALDELAARLTALQNYEIDGGNAYTPAEAELIIDGNGA